MKKFLKNNALSLVFFLLFMITLLGQIYTGFHHYNQELNDDNMKMVSLGAYLHSGHFIQATFENWESEFLQMALFVWLTIYLKQKGSSESKGFGKDEEVDREPSAGRKDAPYPVKKGGFLLAFYKNSLTIVLFLLFLLSILLHFYGSYKDEAVESAKNGLTPPTVNEYLLSSRFWFESFQNWQSEFLSVFAIVFLSIYLRQIGSPQSKPVDAPHSETGE